TSSVAMSMSVPTSKVTFIDIWPVLVLVEDKYAIPGVPLTWVSIGVATDCSTVIASAPVKLPVTETTGGAISGYCVTGKFIRARTPTNKIIKEITIEVTGRLIKTSDIMIC